MVSICLLVLRIMSAKKEKPAKPAAVPLRSDDGLQAVILVDSRLKGLQPLLYERSAGLA